MDSPESLRGLMSLTAHFGTFVHSVILNVRRNRADHIVRRQGPPDPLQLELTYGLDLYGVLDLHQHSRTDENLPRLGFIAEPRGDV